MQGYYHGFPCPRGHTIRDKKRHWCYDCVRSIQSNVCGVDFSYMDHHYRKGAFDFVKEILQRTGRTIQDLDKCWLPDPPFTKSDRYDLYSWRSNMANPKVDRRQLPGKLMYNLFWGDIGTMSVTRTCGNRDCMNPLHMTSSWNICRIGKKLDYLGFHIDQSKVAEFDARYHQGLTVEDIVKRDYKVKIQSAKVVNNRVIEAKHDPNFKHISWHDLQNNES